MKQGREEHRRGGGQKEHRRGGGQKERNAVRFGTRMRYAGSAQTRQTLERLHPGEDGERLLEEHYGRKLKKSLLMVLVGALLSAGLHWKTVMESGLPDGVIGREPVGGSVQVVVLQEASGGEEWEISVSPRQLTAEELQEARGKFEEALWQQVLGENASFEEVRTSLNLPVEVAGYPFEAEWESSHPAILSPVDGTVSEVEGPVEVQLKALISYGEEEWECCRELRILPPELSEEEVLRRDLQGMLETSEEESRTEENWSLPEDYGGRELQWKLVSEDYSAVLFGLSLLVAVLLFFAADHDLDKELEKRRETMKRAYPDVLRQLTLYLGAGMTVRGAYTRIVEEYERRLEKGDPSEPVYEEMGYTCHEISSGTSEMDGYERFGRRTTLQEYIRLTSLLTQNLKRGNSALLLRLREENAMAGREELLRAKSRGEEAQTKLLLPMMLMLLVVMVMVMLPAFGGMQV